MKTNFELVSSVANAIIDENGIQYKSLRKLAEYLGVRHNVIAYNLKKRGVFTFNGINYYLVNPKPIVDKSNEVESQRQLALEDGTPIEITKEEYDEFQKIKNIKSLKFESFDFSRDSTPMGTRYAIALFSDAHIEEHVEPETVMGLNEYNIDIAEKRIKCYFSHLVECIKEDKVNHLYFASLGDTISGYIHEELAQTNELSPLEATYKAQNLIFNGLKYICENCDLDSFKFIGIVGNHGRTTKKIQHSNGFKMSYEWLMYKNVQQACEVAKLPIEFIIPSSEFAQITTPDGKKLMFCHGYQIKGGNGIGGVTVPLNRYAFKLNRVYHFDCIYLGHFHSIITVPGAVINGSIIGCTAYSLSGGFASEPPCQHYEVHDTNIGLLVNRRIYCE